MYDVIIYDTLTSYTAIAMGVHTMTAITATILSSLLLLSSPSTTAVAFLVPHPLFSANNNVIVPRPSSSTKLNIDRRASFCPALGMLPAGGATAWADAAHAILAAGGEDASVSSAADLVASPSAAATLLLSDAGQGLDDTTKLGLAAFAGVGVAAAGFKTAVYWRMQYVVAALLTNRVPKVSGGAEVLELSAKDTKALYYMPAGAVRRLTLSTVKELDQNIVNGAAIQAKVPTALVREQKRGRLNCATGTMDCVVSNYGFSGGLAAGKEGDSGAGGATIRGMAQEVARVLKPGGTLLFVERGEAKELVEVLRETLGKVEVNMVQNLADPYCVALGTKTKVTEEESQATAIDGGVTGQEGGKNRRDRRRSKKIAEASKEG